MKVWRLGGIEMRPSRAAPPLARRIRDQNFLFRLGVYLEARRVVGVLIEDFRRCEDVVLAKGKIE